MTPEAVTEELITSELRGRGGAVLPRRAQVVVRPVEGAAAEAALPRRQRRRVGARQLQGQRDPLARPAPLHRGLPDHRARDRLQQGLRLHPRRVLGPRTRSSSGALEELARPARVARRRDDRRPPRRRRLHLRRGDRAARVARGEARPAALEAAVPGDLGPLRVADGRQQRRDDHDGAAGDRDGRRRVREARRSEHARLARRLGLRATSSTAATSRSRPGTSLREIIYDLAGGIPDGRELKAVVPGGSSTVILTKDEIDVGYDFDSLAQLRTAMGVGGDRRARRPLLHRAARDPLLRVLRARVVRQVHAVPRGHALADGDPAQARGRARDRRATSTCCSTSATASTASASARSATPTRSSSRATSRSSATSSRRTSTGAAARSTATRRSTTCSRRSRCTAHSPDGEWLRGARMS